MTLEVRPVRTAEHDRLADVLVAAYAALLGPRLGDGYRRELANVPARARCCTVLAAVDRGDVLGGVTYIDGPTPYTELAGPHEAEFRFLGVAPWAGGRGVGRALVEACVDLARKDGRARLLLFSTRWMLTAHRLYGGLGFRRTPWRDWHVAPGLYLMAFTRELRQLP
jgi:GNAT superfamily N-acetyltransferase